MPMWRQADIGVMQPQVKGHQQPAEAERKDSPLEPLEGAQPCWSFEFSLLASRTVLGLLQP